MNRSAQHLQWDIFCKVIDNFGDIGVCWRLAADLGARGQHVRLWVDDTSALVWMAPQGNEAVCVLPWTAPPGSADVDELDKHPSDVLIEAFACNPAPEFVAACARSTSRSGLKPVWINLEYLSAEAQAGRNHGLPSPIQSGPAAGWTKWFFYPGFTSHTGGLLREPDLAQRQAAFERDRWLRSHGIESQDKLLVSLFCYEPPALAQLLAQLADSGLDNQPVHLLVAAGRAQRAVEAALSLTTPENSEEKGLHRPVYVLGQLSISYLPLLTQTDFDHLLWACDLNFVRGEDSVVRAVWAGKPFIWQIYPQDDGAHLAKLDAFLEQLDAAPSLRAFHHGWNAGIGSDARVQNAVHDRPAPLAIELPAWRQTAQAARARLMGQADLSSRLMQFVGKNR